MIRFHSRCLLVYGTLSLADLLLTIHLMDGHSGCVYESNPIASACMAAHGTTGLVVYKASAVLAAGAMIGVICMHRPRLGRGVLVFACSAVGVVVLYSGALALLMVKPPVSQPVEGVVPYDETAWRISAMPAAWPRPRRRPEIGLR
jgi:hypothetical protein